MITGFPYIQCYTLFDQMILYVFISLLLQDSSSSLDFIWRLATNFKVHSHNHLDWSVELSSSFNHSHGHMLLKTNDKMPRGYILLKSNEEMGEAGLTVLRASQI